MSPAGIPMNFNTPRDGISLSQDMFEGQGKSFNHPLLGFQNPMGMSNGMGMVPGFGGFCPGMINPQQQMMQQMMQMMMMMLMMMMSMMQQNGCGQQQGTQNFGGFQQPYSAASASASGHGASASASAGYGSPISMNPYGGGFNPNNQVQKSGPVSKPETNQLLENTARKYGIPPDILKSIAWQESRWNPNAVGDGGKSFGMMQIYTSAHPDYNVGEGQRNPSYNIEYGAKFLRSLYDRYGSWEKAVERYNGSGPQAQKYASSVMNNYRNKPWMA
jgi:hypothetical protein